MGKGQRISFTPKNPVTLRSEAIYRHRLSELDASSELIFEEKDDTFSCYVTSSKSEEYIFIGSYSTLTTEFQFLDASSPLEDFQVYSKTYS